MEEEKDKVLYYVGNIPVRKLNYIRLNLNEHEYKRVAEIAVKNNLSLSAVIALQGNACSVCGNDNLTIEIPKGLLSTNKSTPGRTINNRLKNGEQN